MGELKRFGFKGCVGIIYHLSHDSSQHFIVRSDGVCHRRESQMHSVMLSHTHRVMTWEVSGVTSDYM